MVRFSVIYYFIFFVIHCVRKQSRRCESVTAGEQLSEFHKPLWKYVMPVFVMAYVVILYNLADFSFFNMFVLT